MREKLVTELVKEVLGPRRGAREQLDSNPLTEYITGVLAPTTHKTIYKITPEIESEAELPSQDTQSYEEETEDVGVHVPPKLHPALDPKNRPSTMGLSFIVEATENPLIWVCLTWARYKKIKTEDGKTVWQRDPRYAILRIDLRLSNIYRIDSQGKQVTDDSEAEISLHVVVRQHGSNRYLVNLFLVNNIKPDKEDFLGAEDHIFQPQIRVVCGEGTKLVPGIKRTLRDKEGQKLEFLYRHRPVLAKGHLCSAVWRDVDPENQVPPHVNLDFPSCMNEPPFAWPDGELLPPDLRKQFSPPDVRTEFVPVYSIPFPELSWPAEYGSEPELRASVIAEEMWDPEKLRAALSPICTGYERWIEYMEKKLIDLPHAEREIARSLIDECRKVLNRIRAGIDLLCRDEDTRLAFCFANKAIDLQHRWSRKSELKWHPFQLAFILLVLESIADPASPNRNICDLLWVPTGAGKTEAYLAIAAFTIAYRRRRALREKDGERTGAGVSVITRYTLRLLTIQQFRRALAVITACEYLRVLNLGHGGPVGWRPRDCALRDNFLWGSTPFMIGLWVGGGVSPNTLSDVRFGDQIIHGALSILRNESGRKESGEELGEPAQVLNCPACKAILSIPRMGLQQDRHRIHLVIRSDDVHGQELQKKVQEINGKTFGSITVERAEIQPHSSRGFYTLTLEVTSTNTISSRDVDDILWDSISKNYIHADLVPARASRPGYFIRYYITNRGKQKDYDFEIFCPNPECPLHQLWCGGTPTGWIHGRKRDPGPRPDGIKIPPFPDDNRLIDVQEPFRYNGNPNLCDRIPIPALTVDEQIYSRLPAMVVATVDKFARPPFEPEAAALFGNVEFHDCLRGYYRQVKEQMRERSPPAGPAGVKRNRKVGPLRNPDLIIQDELHLIDGPLGSLVGFYETAVDFLCGEGRNHSAKYIASTATIRGAEEHVRALFLRELQLFPPHGITSDDRFFIRDRETHPLDDGPPGRLYVGICAPGRGPLTPIRNIFARLLQTTWELSKNHDVDAFWTLTGYFNAVRELAGARALYRQDIPERINEISAGYARELHDERALELSSRTSATDLPAILDMLNRSYPDAPDALFTTSMFGTGVDIPRIGLMVVNGQPKTTSAYIQSTGRVGRRWGALVVTFLRASRPRDLSHYEFFVGYHRQLHRFVEPVTAYPFSPGVLERALGPVCVFILRNMRSQTSGWHRNNSAWLMANQRTTAPEVQKLPEIFKERADRQPALRKPSDDITEAVRKVLDAWKLIANKYQNRLLYAEYSPARKPKSPVVLGDPQHQHSGLPVVYRNAPTSLRDIEETTCFET